MFSNKKGDMRKAVYDTDDDGAITAESHTHSEYAKEISDVDQIASPGIASSSEIANKVNELIASLKA